MTISTLFFIFISIVAISFIGTIINMFHMANNLANARFTQKIGLHILLAGITAIASLGSLITGIIWIVQCFKS